LGFPVKIYPPKNADDERKALTRAYGAGVPRVMKGWPKAAGRI
jgi:cysteine synthase